MSSSRFSRSFARRPAVCALTILAIAGMLSASAQSASAADSHLSVQVNSDSSVAPAGARWSSI
jgi:hypothetical protein